MRQP
ncbi:tonB-dependent Receptor Plug domain protein, partial [Vibrio cholerae CP1044(17)]|jgi:hypothetical protein